MNEALTLPYFLFIFHVYFFDSAFFLGSIAERYLLATSRERKVAGLSALCFLILSFSCTTRVV